MQTDQHYRHQALLYAGIEDFVARTASFVRDGAMAGEAVQVVVDTPKIVRLRRALGEIARRVRFVDMADLGRNPGRIIGAWHEFVVAETAAGRAVRGIGEPIGPQRSEAELAECQHHEALLNAAFPAMTPFRLVCPYDVSALPQPVIDRALATHPFVDDGRNGAANPAFRPEAARLLDGDLPEPPAAFETVRFDGRMLPRLRAIVARAARATGRVPRRVEEVVLAVNEIASNSVRYGGGRGTARIWTEQGSLYCEIRDRGRIHEPFVGRRRPTGDDVGGYGIWIAHQLADLVQVRSSGKGTVVRLRFDTAKG